MSWASVSTAEEAFSYTGKEYHYGGRDPRTIHDVLTPEEIADFHHVLSIALTAATIYDSVLHGMLVGSVLRGPHHDIDMLLCSDPPYRRTDVVQKTLDTLIQHPFRVDMRQMVGSNLSERGVLFTRKKVFAMSDRYWNVFDISFVGDHAGEWQDVLDFHVRAHLAHLVLE